MHLYQLRRSDGAVSFLYIIFSYRLCLCNQFIHSEIKHFLTAIIKEKNEQYKLYFFDLYEMRRDVCQKNGKGGFQLGGRNGTLPSLGRGGGCVFVFNFVLFSSGEGEGKNHVFFNKLQPPRKKSCFRHKFRSPRVERNFGPRASNVHPPTDLNRPLHGWGVGIIFFRVEMSPPELKSST